jgi:hypothetical protein
MRPSTRRALLAVSVAVVATSRPAGAAAPESYAVGSFPVAPGGVAVEFPVSRGLQGEVGAVLLGQGTYEESNPFTHLSVVSPSAWLHYDGRRNLRLSLGFQELLQREVPAMGLEDGHEERLVGRARIQQPRGAAAIYELLQLDVRSFEDAGGTHRVVFRPRLRIGQGFNLDASRIHSVVLFQEVAFRFSGSDYAERAFEFFRAFVGYTWTTRRGTFVTAGVIGQIVLNPPATAYNAMYGPLLSVNYRFRAAPPAAPPEPTNVDLP